MSNKDKLRRLAFKMVMLDERKRNIITEKDICKFLSEVEKLKSTTDNDKIATHTEAIVEIEKNKKHFIDNEKKRQQNQVGNEDRKAVNANAMQELEEKRKMHEIAIQEIEDKYKFIEAANQDMIIISNHLAVIMKSNEGKDINREIENGRTKLLSLFKDKLQSKLKESLHWTREGKEEYMGITYNDFKRVKFDQDIPSIVSEVMYQISLYKIKKDIETHSCTASDNDENNGLKDELLYLNIVEKRGEEAKKLFNIFKRMCRNPHRPPDRCYITQKYLIKCFPVLFGYEFTVLAKRLFQLWHRKEKKNQFPQRVYFTTYYSCIEPLMFVIA